MSGDELSLNGAGVLLERDRGVATITFDRPGARNALDDRALRAFARILADVAASPDVRVVVVTGAGGDFCSGADLGTLPTGAEFEQRAARVAALLVALHRLPQPTIAMVQGVAVGAGMNIALLCDLVVAGASARFCEVFSRRGLAIDAGGSWVLPRAVGLHRAKELAFFADALTAAEAFEIGLVNRVLPDTELDGFTAEWAQRLAAGPPIGLARTKQLLNGNLGVTLEEALAEEMAVQAVVITTDDVREGVDAFLEKRRPVFHGC